MVNIDIGANGRRHFEATGDQVLRVARDERKKPANLSTTKKFADEKQKITQSTLNYRQGITAKSSFKLKNLI